MSEVAGEGPASMDRLAEALVPGLSPATAERLLKSPRLGERARALLAGNAAASMMALTDADRTLAEAGSDGLDRAASLAGAVWHADRVRGLMLARDLQPFLDAHGPAARDAALRHADLAPSPAPDLGDMRLADQVREDGLACVSAWIETLPTDAANAVRLRRSPDSDRPPGDAHRAHGPAILRAVSTLLGSTAGPG